MTLERGNAFTPVASATMIWPWGTATAAGAVTGVGSFLLNLSPNVLESLLSGASTGIFFFALVGGAVALFSSKGDRRARRYASQYPWRTAMPPALLGAAGTGVAAYISAIISGPLLTSILLGWIPAALIGLLAGGAIWAILGVIGMVAGGRSK